MVQGRMVSQGGSANCVPARLRIRGKANALTNTCPGYTNPDLRHESCVGATFALLALSRIDLSAATPLHIPPDLYSYRAYLMRWLVGMAEWEGLFCCLKPHFGWLSGIPKHSKYIFKRCRAICITLHPLVSFDQFRREFGRFQWVKPSSRTFAFTTPSGH